MTGRVVLSHGAVFGWCCGWWNRWNSGVVLVVCCRTMGVGWLWCGVPRAGVMGLWVSHGAVSGWCCGCWVCWFSGVVVVLCCRTMGVGVVGGVFVVWLLFSGLWCWVGVGGVGLVVFGVCFRHAGGDVCFQGFGACFVMPVCVGVPVGVSCSFAAAERSGCSGWGVRVGLVCVVV